eukprot:scaffold152577_cov17-Tisochrysis_lutea.AAC.1
MQAETSPYTNEGKGGIDSIEPYVPSTVCVLYSLYAPPCGVKCGRSWCSPLMVYILIMSTLHGLSTPRCGDCNRSAHGCLNPGPDEHHGKSAWAGSITPFMPKKGSDERQTRNRPCEAGRPVGRPPGGRMQ